VRRLSEVVAESVKKAIAELDILAVDRDAVEWEVIAHIADDSSVRWLVGIGLPVPGFGDTIMPFTPLSDPHSQDDVTRTVRALYRAVAQQVLSVSVPGGTAKAADELRTSPGGLIIT